MVSQGEEGEGHGVVVRWARCQGSPMYEDIPTMQRKTDTHAPLQPSQTQGYPSPVNTTDEPSSTQSFNQHIYKLAETDLTHLHMHDFEYP